VWYYCQEKKEDERKRMQIYPEKRKDYVGDYTPVRRNPKKMIGKNTLQKSYRINDHKGGSREGRKNCLFKIIVGVLIVPASRIFVNKSRSPR
jgi:hypothetical protein